MAPPNGRAVTGVAVPKEFTVGRDPLNPNPYHRYALPEAAYLADADEARYVLISPETDGYRVERGVLRAAGVGTPDRAPSGPAERFPPGELARAVQRVCALAADWLGYDEREVEEARRLFLA